MWSKNTEKEREGVRFFDTVLLIFFAALICVTAAAILFFPQREFSEIENRRLQTVSDIDIISDAKSGRLTEKIGDMLSDQFPFRHALTKLKADIELCLLRHENNGVLSGKNGALIPKLEYSETQMRTLEKSIADIGQFSSYMKERGSRVTFSAVPRSVDIMVDSLPDIYSPDRAYSARSRLSEAECFFLYDAIEEHGEEYAWFKTDHHWTARGAYYAYTELANELSFLPVPISELTPETVSREFFGTSWSKSGMYRTAPDTIELLRFSSDESFSVTDAESGKLLLCGLYDLKKLNVKDKYSVFLGGDYGHIKISDGSKKPRLLVIKDSYFNAIAPFLCRHFELDVIDLRYYSGSVAKYAQSTGAKDILILCGIDSLAASPTFSQLMYGIN